MTVLLYLAGLALVVAAAFLVAVPLGIAAAGCALLFIGWASTTPDKE